MTAPLTPAERARLRDCAPPAGLSPTQWAALVQGRAPVPLWLRPRLAPLLVDPVPAPSPAAVVPEPAPTTPRAPQTPTTSSPAPAPAGGPPAQGTPPQAATGPVEAPQAPARHRRKRRRWDPDTLAVAAVLGETRQKPRALIRRWLKAQGRPWVEALVAQAQTAHAAGTERRQDGTPRTLGGGFFALAKRAVAGQALEPTAPRP